MSNWLEDWSGMDVPGQPPWFCPYCGEPMTFTGFDDGGGDYGDSVCEIWECVDCDWSEEHDCFSGDDESAG